MLLGVLSSSSCATFYPYIVIHKSRYKKLHFSEEKKHFYVFKGISMMYEDVQWSLMSVPIFQYVNREKSWIFHPTSLISCLSSESLSSWEKIRTLGSIGRFSLMILINPLKSSDPSVSSYPCYEKRYVRWNGTNTVAVPHTKQFCFRIYVTFYVWYFVVKYLNVTVISALLQRCCCIRQSSQCFSKKDDVVCHQKIESVLA